MLGLAEKAGGCSRGTCQPVQDLTELQEHLLVSSLEEQLVESQQLRILLLPDLLDNILCFLPTGK